LNDLRGDALPGKKYPNNGLSASCARKQTFSDELFPLNYQSTLRHFSLPLAERVIFEAMPSNTPSKQNASSRAFVDHQQTRPSTSTAGETL
jgi:hypothetical protein